uniref:Uncharacterized protein n=1 Tax=viral metagenome TaxID=1070528 RepID=A0A6C0C7H3_9ZZZZ
MLYQDTITKMNLRARIHNLPIDLRRLLFTYFLVRQRNIYNSSIIDFVHNDISMRTFINIKIDRRFWTISDTVFYMSNCTLKMYFGIWFQIPDKNTKMFQKIIDAYRVINNPTCAIYTERDFVIQSQDVENQINIKTHFKRSFFGGSRVFEPTEQFYCNVRMLSRLFDGSKYKYFVSCSPRLCSHKYG